jgi:hypothetical protein
MHDSHMRHGQMGAKVYCSKDKAATLAACGLAPEYASLITTNHLETNYHAVRGPIDRLV